MSAPETIDEAIEQSALGPKKVQVGNRSVEQHPIADLVAAREAIAQSDAASRSHLGIRFRKMIPGGTG